MKPVIQTPVILALPSPDRVRQQAFARLDRMLSRLTAVSNRDIFREVKQQKKK